MKSAYKVYREHILRTRRSGVASSEANGRQEEEFWRKLWKLKCPGKIKHFLWRMGHNSLALRVNLRRRGMDLDTKCVMCNRLDEDGGHLFLKCKLVKQLWRELNLQKVRLRHAEQNSAKTMMAFFLGETPGGGRGCGDDRSPPE